MWACGLGTSGLGAGVDGGAWSASSAAPVGVVVGVGVEVGVLLREEVVHLPDFRDEGHEVAHVLLIPGSGVVGGGDVGPLFPFPAPAVEGLGVDHSADGALQLGLVDLGEHGAVGEVALESVALPAHCALGATGAGCPPGFCPAWGGRTSTGGAAPQTAPPNYVFCHKSKFHN